MTTKDTHTKDEKDTTDHGKQGFASKSKEEVKEIASKGGSSHGTSHKDDKDHKTNSHTTKAHSIHENKDEHEDGRKSKDGEHREHGKQGFASMPHEQVVEIARKGGQHSHDNDGKKKNDDNED